MEHLPVKELDELQDIVPTGEELLLLWHTELGVGKASLLDMRAATATYIDHVSATVETIDPDAAPRVEVEETQGDATGRHRGYVFHHYLPSGVTIDDISIGTVTPLLPGASATAAIRDVSIDDNTTNIDESKAHKCYKVDFGIPSPYGVDVDMTATVLNANEMPTANWTAEHTDNTKAWHLSLGLPRAKGISLKPTTILNAGSTPTVTDEGDVNESQLHFSLPAPYDIDLSLSLTVLDPGQQPTAILAAIPSENKKKWVLNIGLAPGMPFTVAKVYPSIEAMASDYNSADVAIGQFVIINTGNVEDEDNAKLFLKGEASFQFMCDLSGAQGIRGATGATGHTPLITFNAGSDIAESGTPSITQEINDNGDATVTLHKLRGKDGKDGQLGVPIGYVYTQYPSTPSPQELWPSFTWTDISARFSGSFFRALGGDSAAWQVLQAEGLPNITGTTGAIAMADYAAFTGAFVNGSFVGYAMPCGYGSTGATQGDFNAARCSAVYGASTHVTPVNFAIKIWQRTA